jgi:integrase
LFCFVEKNPKVKVPKRARISQAQWPGLVKRLQELYPDYAEHAKCRRLLTPATPTNFRQLDLTIKRLLDLLHPRPVDQELDATTLQILQDNRHLFAYKAMRLLFAKFNQGPVHASIVEELCRSDRGRDCARVRAVLARMRAATPAYRNHTAVRAALLQLRAFHGSLDTADMTLPRAVDFAVCGLRAVSSRGSQLRACVLLACGLPHAEHALQAGVNECETLAMRFRALKRRQARTPPHGAPQAPPGAPQAPRGVPQAPRGVPQAPRGVPQAPRGVPQAPRGAPQAPQSRSLKNYRLPMYLEVARELGCAPEEAARHHSPEVLTNKWRDRPRVLHMLEVLAQLQGSVLTLTPQDNTEGKARKLSAWHSGLLDEMVQFERNSHRTAFPEKRMINLRYQFSRLLLHLDAQATKSSHTSLRRFFAQASQEEWRAAIRQLLLSIEAQPHLVKSAMLARHQATSWARIALRFLKGCLATHVATDLGPLSLQSLLKGIVNQTSHADPTRRRTFTDKEIQAMLDVAKDPAEEVMVTLLHEIGLRRSAVGHLQYHAVLDDNHEPREECAVREKGGKLRGFAPSVNLRTRIKRLSDFLRAHHNDEQLRDAFLLNLTDLTRPFGAVYFTVRRLAQDAGITDVRVHPHAFRHTLVGNLVKSGNSMEVVSKFLGHADVRTTSFFYWVPTPAELRTNLLDSSAPRDLAHAKAKASRALLRILQRHCDMQAVRQECPEFDHVLAQVSGA